MSDKIDRFRQRRYDRLKRRAEAGEGHFDDEGRWVTTHEKKRKIHINENGVPDKGNPFVIAKMTGTKPRISATYRKKMIQAGIKKGKPEYVDAALKDLPPGSVIRDGGGMEYTKGATKFKLPDGSSVLTKTVAKTLGKYAELGVEDFDVILPAYYTKPSSASEAKPASTGAPKPGSTGAPKPGSTGAPTASIEDRIKEAKGKPKLVTKMLEELPDGSKVKFGASTYEKHGSDFERTSTADDFQYTCAAAGLAYSLKDLPASMFSITTPEKGSLGTAGKASSGTPESATTTTESGGRVKTAMSKCQSFSDKADNTGWHGGFEYYGSGKPQVDFFKKNSNFDTLISNMTPEQEGAFGDWTSGFFMSGAQYGGWNNMDKYERKVTRHMDEVLDRARLDEGVTVCRLATPELVLGKGKRTATLEELQAMKGKTVFSKGAMSCGVASEGLKIGSSSKPVEYKIAVPGGTKGAGMWIGDDRINGWGAKQREFVLNRDTEYEVGDTTYDPARKVYVVELMYTGRQPHDYGRK